MSDRSSIIGRGWAFPLGINRQGGIALTDEQSEIAEAIRIILSTSPGERVMRPTFGSRLHELVFAPINTETFALAQRYVKDALGMWEPRIQVTEVEVFTDYQEGDGCLMLIVHYEVKATHDQRSLVYPFYVIPEE